MNPVEYKVFSSSEELKKWQEDNSVEVISAVPMLIASDQGYGALIGMAEFTPGQPDQDNEPRCFVLYRSK